MGALNGRTDGVCCIPRVRRSPRALSGASASRAGSKLLKTATVLRLGYLFAGFLNGGGRLRAAGK